MDWCFSWYNPYLHGNVKTKQMKIGETWILRRPHVISSSKYQYLKLSWQVYVQYRFDFETVAKTFQINYTIGVTIITKTTGERYFNDIVSNNTKMLSWSHESFAGVLFRDLKKETFWFIVFMEMPVAFRNTSSISNYRWNSYIYLIKERRLKCLVSYRGTLPRKCWNLIITVCVNFQSWLQWGKCSMDPMTKAKVNCSNGIP